MPHQRKIIRHAVVAALVNATAAGGRVKATRVDPHKKGGLPAISVYTSSEAVEEANAAPLELTRDVALEVVGWVADSDAVPVDDAMDDIAEQIETVLSANRYLDGEAADMVLQSTVMQVREENGGSDPLIGVVVLTYSVTYRTSPPPPPDLVDFLSVNAMHRILGAVEANQANDQFNVKEPTP